jgi:hypothetical protein
MFLYIYIYIYIYIYMVLAIGHRRDTVVKAAVRKRPDLGPVAPGDAFVFGVAVCARRRLLGFVNCSPQPTASVWRGQG